MKIFLVQMDGFDSAAVTFFFATVGFTTSPVDTPANTHFEEKVSASGFVKRDLFRAGATFGRSRVSFGDVVLRNAAQLNQEGDLDFLNDVAFDGRDITVWFGEDDGAFPGDFEEVFTATMEQALVARTEVTVKVRGLGQSLELPFREVFFAGTGDLEGGDDLAEKPKPFAFGATLNVGPILVNRDENIYQMHDGAVDDLTVYDRGAQIGSADNFSFSDFTTPGENLGVSNAIAYSPTLNLFVMAGAIFRAAMTSPDGEVWTLREIPGATIAVAPAGTTTLEGVAWDEDAALFVAVGDNGASGAGKIFTSPDGVVWTARTSTTTATNKRLLDAAYAPALNRWVVVGEDAHIETAGAAADQWTSQTSAFTGTSIIYSVAWSPSLALFCAVGDNGEINTSTDGFTWTLRTSTHGTSTINSVAWDEVLGIFVAIGTGVKYSSSTDGINWTARTVPGSPVGTPAQVIATKNGFLVAGPGSGVYHSVDGITWTFKALASTGSIKGIAVGSGLTVGVFDTKAATSLMIRKEYASTSDLLDSDLEPEPKTAGTFLAGGYFRIGAAPDGIITADVTIGSLAADRTAGQAFAALMTAKGVAFNSNDVDDLDSLQDAVVGFYLDTSVVRTAAIVDDVTESVGAWWGEDRQGVMRIARLDDPSAQSSILTLRDTDMMENEPLERLRTNDTGRGVPFFRTVVRYAKNWTVQRTDIPQTLSDARRSFLEERLRDASYEDTSVQTKHLLAGEFQIDTLLLLLADADTEAVRLQSLRGVKRDRFEFGIELTATTVVIDQGDIIEVIHPRFGLSGGKNFVVLSVESDPRNKTVTLGIWG